MAEKSKANRWIWVVSLPLLFFGLTYIVWGFYYETNDDQLITLLLRGITIQPALNNLSIYFYGWSGVLTHLYQWLPALPWYGLFLYTGLLGATMLAFSLLWRAANDYVKTWQLLLLITVFYLAGWLEHVMWFNYMRVPFLLAGTAYLVLVQQMAKKHSPWCYLVLGLVFIAALAIRPSAALLGLALVGPVFLFFAKGQSINRVYLRPMFLYGSIAFIFLLFLRLNQTPAVKEYQRLDWLKSTVLDFQIYEAKPANQADSLAFKAIDNWLLADTRVVNEKFYAQTGAFNLAFILKQVAPSKLAHLTEILVRDQFLVLSLNAILLFYLFFRFRPESNFSRQLLLGYQLYFWGLIIIIGVLLKLPPRVITPALSLYILVHLVIFFRVVKFGNNSGKISKPLIMLILLLVGLQIYKFSHRAALQHKQKQKHEVFLADIGASFENKILVSAVFPDYLRSLSPFRNYNFGNNSVFLLTGWSTLDPGYKNYFTRISGEPDFAATVGALARNPASVWLLTPDFKGFFNEYMQVFYQQPLPIRVWPHRLSEKYPVQVYRPAGNKE
jgi:hypothetical protein